MIVKNKARQNQDNKIKFKGPIAGGLIGVAISSFASIYFADSGNPVEKIVNLILGILGLSMGLGLWILIYCEKNNEDKDSINIFIGKQLFEKGLHGILIGVVLWLLDKI